MSTETKPVAVLALQSISAVLGAIVQLDGRDSYDPLKKSLVWDWEFMEIPYGSAVGTLRAIKYGDRAVSFVPDKVGSYLIKLTVTNGDEISDPVTVEVSARLSRVPCGESIVPDADFLWDYMSDFWGLVPDKDVFTTSWSAAIQLVGAELVKLWGAENGSSIATISDTLQRKWQRYPTVIDLKGVQASVVAGNTDSGTNGKTGSPYGETDSGTSNLFYLPKGPRRTGTTTDFTVLNKSETAAHKSFGAKGRAIEINGESRVIDRVSNGTSIVVAGLAVSTEAGASNILVDHSSLELDIGHKVTVVDGPDAGVYFISDLSVGAIEVKAGGESLAFVGDSTTANIEYEVTVVRVTDPVTSSQVGIPWRVPHLLHIPGYDFTGEMVSVGDILTLEVQRNDIGLSADIEVQITSVHGSSVGFEFTLNALEDAAENVDIGIFIKLVEDLRISVAGYSGESESIARALVGHLPAGLNLASSSFSPYRLTFYPKSILRNSKFPGSEELISTPSLQNSVTAPSELLQENKNYYIDESGDFVLLTPYAPLNPAPVAFWAEYVFVSNDPAIENNFGTLVSLTRESFYALMGGTSYLAAVKGLMYAYTTGVSADTLRLSMQIFFGLPFAETRGVIIHIDEEFSSTPGGVLLDRVVLEDLDESNVPTKIRRSYYYPTDVGIEDHPHTGEPYKLGDIVSQFRPLSKGVTVDDYVSDPDWWRLALGGVEVLKFFTFGVRIAEHSANAASSAEAVKFLNLLKPTYTNFITSVLKSLSDDVSVEEAAAFPLVAKFFDSPSGLEPSSRAVDGNQQGFNLQLPGSSSFATITPLLVDIVTSEAGASVEVKSDIGWGGHHVRPRIAIREGDILALLPSQLGSYPGERAYYEIASVEDDNTLTILREMPVQDLENYDTLPVIDTGVFEYGYALAGSILRRVRNPLTEGTDGVSTLSGIASTSAHFSSSRVRAGDYLVIASGVNLGAYLVAGFGSVPEEELTLLNLDGSETSLTPSPNEEFYVINPRLRENTVSGCHILEDSPEFLISKASFGEFTPDLVGSMVEVFGSSSPANNGVFYIKEFTSRHAMAIDNPLAVVDTSGDVSVRLWA